MRAVAVVLSELNLKQDKVSEIYRALKNVISKFLSSNKSKIQPPSIVRNPKSLLTNPILLWQKDSQQLLLAKKKLLPQVQVQTIALK